MKYRSRIDIISLILETANGGEVTKTNIMYKAYLGYAQLKEYLTILTENNLISYNELTQTFRTTEKGLRFINIYNQLGDVLKASSQ
jgi:predicted transcriptional regulator